MFNSWVNLKGLLPDHFFDFAQPLLAGKGDPEGNLTIDTNDFHDAHGDLTQYSVQFSSVQPLSRVQLFATPWTAALQASLSITNSWSLLKLMYTESVTPSNHLILCCPFSSCLQSFSASGSFQRVRWSQQVAKVLEFQLQHQSFQ